MLGPSVAVTFNLVSRYNWKDYYKDYVKTQKGAKRFFLGPYFFCLGQYFNLMGK